MPITSVPHRRRVLVLLNPGAGKGPALDRARKHLQAAEDLQLDVIIPDPADQGRQLDEAHRAVEAGVDAVVVCGGDGMVSLGVNLIAKRGIPLGIVPTGSGNDFARTVGITRRPAEAAWGVLHAVTQPVIPLQTVDAMRVKIRVTSTSSEQTRWAANSVNIGFDAHVNQRANAQRTVHRQLRYLVALAHEVPRFRAVDFGVQLDAGTPTVKRSSLICLQNGCFIGGGIPLAQGGKPDDGVAEVSHVAALSRLGLLTLFPLLMMRMHHVLKPLVTERFRKIRIEVPETVPVFADGEELHSGLPQAGYGVEVEVEVVAGAVHLLR